MVEKKWDETNTGVLFNNIDEKTTEKSPDYRGKVNVDGTEFILAAWIKVGRKSGKKFLSIQVQSQEAYRKAMESYRAKSNGDADSQPEYNDEIPF